MNRKQSWLPVIRMAGIYLVICTFFTYLDSVAAVADYRLRGGTEIWRPIVWSGTSVFVIGVLAFWVYRLAAAFPVHKKNWLSRCLLHFGASLVFSLVHIGLMVLLRKLIYFIIGHRYIYGTLWDNLAYEFSKDFVTYASIVVLSYAFIFWKQFNDAKLKALKLEADLAHLKLGRLQEQLRPHFLFNTLNHISSCMYEDVEKADELLADLCNLLRYSLKEEMQFTVSLGEELRFLNLYIHLMDSRFSGRLDTQVNIQPELEGAQVPRFLLQPLVENAIQHGFRDRYGEGRICIDISKSAGRLLINVKDNGVGLSPNQPAGKGSGLGLGNTRAILQQLYGEDFYFELEPDPKGGARVRIDLPLSEQTHPPSSVFESIAKGA